MASLMSLLAPFAWAIVAACITAAALRKRSTVTRAVFGFLAACVAFGVIGDIRTLDRRALVSTSDDRAWSQVRQAYINTVPAFAEMITLSPAIESKFREALLPVFRSRDTKGSDARDAAAATVFNDVLDKHIMPVAVHGSTAAINAWGGITAPMLQQLALLSTEACAVYATTRVARYANHPKIAALIQTGYRAIIDGYKTSDSSKYPLPDRKAFVAEYVKAMRSAQPPFSNEEFDALEDLEKASPQRQCDLTLRLYEAIDRLDPSSRAIIYRYLMKNPD